MSQIPSLLVSTAAGIVVTKGGMEGSTEATIVRQLGGAKPLALAATAAGVLALMPGLPVLPFLALACLAGGGAYLRWKTPEAAAEPAVPAVLANAEAPIAEALRIDHIRIELGYGLLGLAGGEGARLTEQIKALRRAIATDLGFILPAVRIQDNMELGADEYCVRIKEIVAGRGQLRPGKFLAMGDAAFAPRGEPTQEPAFGLPATWVEAADKDEAALRGLTVVDPSSVLATHLTELVKQNLAELLSFAETQKLIDDLPREHQKLVTELIPSLISTGGVQRVLQGLLAELVSIRDLATILEGIQEASTGQTRAIPAIVGHVRTRLARQLCL